MPELCLPLSLYIHIPWCVRKCPYCDFNSHAVNGENGENGKIPEAAYIKALIADLDETLPFLNAQPFASIFLGGGTPSLFSASGLEVLLKAIDDRGKLALSTEITLEANPGTLSEPLAGGKLAAYKAIGINRLSLGIQSFNPAHLAALGRIHGSEEALHSARLALSLFEYCNLDLMYGLPQQTPQEALEDLKTALRLNPPHLSLYQLTLEPHTRFAAFPPPLPDPDLCAEMGDMLETLLAENGFNRYEISAFARPQKECRHNLNYWHFGDYLGIGAGAHSKLTFSGQVFRQMRHKRPESYLKAAFAAKNPPPADMGGSPFFESRFIQEAHTVPTEELPFEFLMNALRLAEGFHPGLFEARTGTPFSNILPRLQEAENDGLICITREKIMPTEKGRRFLNLLLGRFL